MNSFFFSLSPEMRSGVVWCQCLTWRKTKKKKKWAGRNYRKVYAHPLPIHIPDWTDIQSC